MRGVLSKTVHAIVLAAAILALAQSFAACGGEAAVSLVPAPTPTRTPLPTEG